VSLAVRRIGLIGCGEVGTILGEDLVRAGCDVRAFDILFDAPAERARLQRKAERVRIELAGSTRAAILDADLIISAVTAASSADAAAAAAPALRPGQIFLDINSVSPATKRSNAQQIERSGADYVEAAVMAAIAPQRLAVPMLLGGRRASELAEALRALGMQASAISQEIGVASAVKMCRSILIKGLEALTLECLLGARRFGAEQYVLASLDASFPRMGWCEALPDYLVSRVAEHGKRRAEEMREVAHTLASVGIEPLMAAATAQRQQELIERMAARGIDYASGTYAKWQQLVDELQED